MTVEDGTMPAMDESLKKAFERSRRRLADVARGRKPDRIPVMAFMDSYPAVLFGCPLKDYYQDAALCVKLQIRARQFFDTDDSPSYGWADWGGWEFGGDIRFPESPAEISPRTARFPVTRPSWVERLKIPDPKTAGLFPNLMLCNRMLRSLGLPAKIRAGSVSSVAASIVGPERLLQWFGKEPEAVELLFDKAAEFIIRGADMVIRAFGVENCSVFMSTPMDSNNLISGKMFRKFAAGRIQRINQWLIRRGVARFVVHLCGDHSRNLGTLADLPWPDRSVFSIGEMDLETVARAFGHKHIIGGNISTTLLALGSAREVFEEARKCVKIGRRLPGGFILMPACSMPLVTPAENISAMVRAARSF